MKKCVAQGKVWGIHSNYLVENEKENKSKQNCLTSLKLSKYFHKVGKNIEQSWYRQGFSHVQYLLISVGHIEIRQQVSLGTNSLGLFYSKSEGNSFFFGNNGLDYRRA